MLFATVVVASVVLSLPCGKIPTAIETVAQVAAVVDEVCINIESLSTGHCHSPSKSNVCMKNALNCNEWWQLKQRQQ